MTDDLVREPHEQQLDVGVLELVDAADLTCGSARNVGSTSTARTTLFEGRRAKVGVEGSNPLARSSFLLVFQLDIHHPAWDRLHTSARFDGIVRTL